MLTAGLFVRPERPQDHPQVFETHLRAFGAIGPGRLVESLRNNARPAVSLVALVQGNVVGHILFTPVSFVATSARNAMLLGPLAVRPEYQRHGIGGRLIQVGLDALKIGAMDMVVTAGPPELFRRFGFQSFNEQDTRMQAAALRPGVLNGLAGQVRLPAGYLEAVG